MNPEHMAQLQLWMSIVAIIAMGVIVANNWIQPK